MQESVAAKMVKYDQQGPLVAWIHAPKPFYCQALSMWLSL